MTPQKSERFEMRLDQSTIDQVDAWRAKQSDYPSRSEAARRLIEAGLEHSEGKVRISDGEKLLLVMMRDLYKHLNLKDGEIDPEFVAETLWGGHYWGLSWKYSGLFHGYEDGAGVVREVVDILDMWDFMEDSFERLSAAEKQRFANEMEPFTDVQFPGFDGNNESSHMGVLMFLTGPMERFSRFKKREPNSHMPVLEGYRRMYAEFEPMRVTLTGGRMTLAQIMKVFAARWPEGRRKGV